MPRPAEPPEVAPARGRRAPPQWPAGLRGARGLGTRRWRLRVRLGPCAACGARRCCAGCAAAWGGAIRRDGGARPSRGPGRLPAPLWGTLLCIWLLGLGSPKPDFGALWASFTFLLAQHRGRDAGGTPCRKVRGLPLTLALRPKADCEFPRFTQALGSFSNQSLWRKTPVHGGPPGALEHNPRYL